jgi:hypothetical protein
MLQRCFSTPASTSNEWAQLATYLNDELGQHHAKGRVHLLGVVLKLQGKDMHPPSHQYKRQVAQRMCFRGWQWFDTMT